MQLDVTYTLFIALVIVCGARGLGWWGASLLQRRRSRRAPDVTAMSEEIPARAPETTDAGAIRA